MLLMIGWIPKATQAFEPAGHRYGRTVMREGLEAAFALVSITATAEGSVLDNGVEHDLQVLGNR